MFFLSKNTKALLLPICEQKLLSGLVCSDDRSDNWPQMFEADVSVDKWSWWYVKCLNLPKCTRNQTKHSASQPAGNWSWKIEKKNNEKQAKTNKQQTNKSNWNRPKQRLVGAYFPGHRPVFLTFRDAKFTFTKCRVCENHGEDKRWGFSCWRVFSWCPRFLFGSRSVVLQAVFRVDLSQWSPHKRNP